MCLRESPCSQFVTTVLIMRHHFSKGTIVNSLNFDLNSKFQLIEIVLSFLNRKGLIIVGTSKGEALQPPLPSLAPTLLPYGLLAR